MAFSNDEQIVVEKNTTLKNVVLAFSFLLFGISLFNIAFCTTTSCRSSLESFLLGWLALLTDVSAFCWLANPMLFISWILLIKNKHYSWVFGFLATACSLSFLAFDNIIDNEAGLCNPITKIGVGYWLWAISCFTTFLGGLLFRKQNIG